MIFNLFIVLPHKSLFFFVKKLVKKNLAKYNPKLVRRGGFEIRN